MRLSVYCSARAKILTLHLGFVIGVLAHALHQLTCPLSRAPLPLPDLELSLYAGNLLAYILSFPYPTSCFDLTWASKSGVGNARYHNRRQGRTRPEFCRHTLPTGFSPQIPFDHRNLDQYQHPRLRPTRPQRKHLECSAPSTKWRACNPSAPWVPTRHPTRTPATPARSPIATSICKRHT
jgi:hypothetical protein